MEVTNELQRNSNLGPQEGTVQEESINSVWARAFKLTFGHGSDQNVSL